MTVPLMPLRRTGRTGGGHVRLHVPSESVGPAEPAGTDGTRVPLLPGVQPLMLRVCLSVSEGPAAVFTDVRPLSRVCTHVIV